MKLSFLLAHDEFVAAFLLAGAPSALWDLGVGGTEFFAGREWAAHEVRLTFRKAFESTRRTERKARKTAIVRCEFQRRFKRDTSAVSRFGLPIRTGNSDSRVSTYGSTGLRS
ncbi:MAG: hypothetical protein ABI927_08795 [Gaiellaceae bacterium]